MKGMKDLLFGGAGGGSAMADLGLAGLRLFAGLSLSLAHGRVKMPPSDGFIDGVGDLGFPVPIVFAWAAALSEFVGGLLLALGLVTRPASLFILTTMCVAGFLRHADDPYRVKELAFLFGSVVLMFMLVGAGRFSADALIRRRL